MASYELRINGHVDSAHTPRVTKLAHELLDQLRALGGSFGVTLGGSISDDQGATVLEAGEPHGATGKPALEHTGRGEAALPA